jgi:hypothetical protein
MEKSTRADVVSYAGSPDAEARGHEPGSSPYRILGYGCGHGASRTAADVWSKCQTVFWVDIPTGQLEAFDTRSPQYIEARGVRIGMTTAEAERRFHTVVHPGCEDNAYFENKTGSLTVAFDGGQIETHDGVNTLNGGHVSEFVLHGATHNPGVFDCE